MKGTAQLFSDATNGGSDDWATPQTFFDLLNAEFNFELDPCASAAFAKCAAFIPPEEDGLATSWEGMRAFVNFPYSDAEAWADKCILEADNNSLVVVLCAARTDTGWWQRLAARSSEIRFVKGRLSFVQQKLGKLPRGMSATFPSTVMVLSAAEWCEPVAPRCVLWDVPSSIRRGVK